MVTLNEIKIKEELLNLIRNGDIISTNLRKVTTTTDNITGVAGSTITLTNSYVTNIREVIIDSVVLTAYVDYDINIYITDKDNSKIINLTTPLTGGESIEVTYDYSPDESGDKVYPDFPEDFLKVGSFPRIGFEIESITNTNRSTNDTLQQKNVLINFIVISDNKTVDTYESSLYNLLFDNRKNMKCNNLMRPSGRTGKEPYKKFSSTIMYSKMFSYILPTEFEK